jgi:hypothetical protein
MTPTLIYLHGIGAEHDDAWRDLMSAALVEVGYPGLFDGVECCAPKYPNTLRYPSDERHDLPPQTSPRLSGRERDELRWRVERATADLERAIGVHTAGWRMPLAAETVPALMKVIPQARRYLGTRPRVPTPCIACWARCRRPDGSCCWHTALALS